jgi:mannose-1-phosphate guanylyltransferase/mannose-6-phosphate isomerase
MIPVILCGGGGTRLWPLSRQHHPKQFIPLTGTLSPLQQTLLRLDGLAPLSSPILITNDEHRFLVAEQLRQIQKNGQILLEPVSKNTAPAVALAAFQAMDTQAGVDPVLLVLPSDHLIEEVEQFHQTVLKALPFAEQGHLVTFGVSPSRPETGFGYIKRGEPIEQGFFIDEFVEKPEQDRAQTFLDSGDYCWNAGMFLFKASRYLAELKCFQPEIYSAAKRAYEESQTDLDFIRVGKAGLDCIDGLSIDHAVMEKTDLGVLVPLDVNWNDIGSWDALWEIGDKDENGNVSKGDATIIDCENSYVQSTDRLVAAIGIKNLLVVQTADATLVAPKDNAQAIKKLVERLLKEGRDESHIHQEVHRPWGVYESINIGDGYQVKRVIVKPKCSLSLQLHHQRAEHWVVVSGAAQVTRGEETYTVNVNESTYIPMGCKHRLENTGDCDLHLIEVQSGEYLGEDDIVRFDDKYGRT